MLEVWEIVVIVIGVVAMIVLVSVIFVQWKQISRKPGSCHKRAKNRRGKRLKPTIRESEVWGSETNSHNYSRMEMSYGGRRGLEDEGFIEPQGR